MKEVFVMAKIFTKDNYQLTVQDLIDLLEQIPNKNIPVYSFNGDGMKDVYPCFNNKVTHETADKIVNIFYCSPEYSDEPSTDASGKVLHKEYLII